MRGGAAGSRSIVQGPDAVTLAHEVFHWWAHAGLVRPEARWFGEGITNYYGIECASKTSLITEDDAMGCLADLAAEMRFLEQDGVRSLSSVSDEYARDGRARRIVYSKGTLFGLFLDRELAGRDRDLDEWTGNVLSQKRRDLTNADLRRLFEDVYGASAARSFDAFVTEATALPDLELGEATGHSGCARYLPGSYELDEDLRIYPVVPGVWRHVSFKVMPEYGRVPANGLIVVGTDSGALIDTPWTDDQTGMLFDWAKRELGTTIGHVVATHSHDDCMGGLAEAHRRGATSYAFELTAEFAERDRNPVPRKTFTEKLRISLGSVDLELRYFGGGHTRDNIVVWIPQRKMLFGGCLVKRKGGSAGYTAEADLTAWPDTIRDVLATFPEATVVVPGHGPPGTVEYLQYTLILAEGLER
jgi:metallo-beta-lactamase class B